MGSFNIPEISAEEAVEQLKKDPSVKLIDVRTDEEYSIARIAGAVLVNQDEKMDEVLSWPKDTPIIVHCHHGMRSRQAAGFLTQRGFTRVSNLAGGIDAWSQDVDPSIPRY